MARSVVRHPERLNAEAHPFRALIPDPTTMEDGLKEAWSNSKSRNIGSGLRFFWVTNILAMRGDIWQASVADFCSIMAITPDDARRRKCRRLYLGTTILGRGIVSRVAQQMGNANNDFELVINFM